VAVVDRRIVNQPQPTPMILRRPKSKSPDRSGLQLDVFWQAALSVSEAAAIEVRLSSKTLTVT
jgi:hypothetical protein